MTHRIEYWTAQTHRGRKAIAEVMQHSYADDIDRAPARWTRVRVVDGTPVSFIQLDPDRWMDMPRGEMQYAFILNVATREDRRREGHFRGIMEHAFASLRDAGIPLVCTHGRYQLYRRFGFGVFTHHCGIFATPELIATKQGAPVSEEGRSLLVVDQHKGLKEDLLLISDVKATTLSECKSALKAAAAMAQERGKTRILFEHPPAPSYGSRYPIHASPETPLTALARACGAETRLQGADPESGSIPDADWIKVLDAEALVGRALNGLEPSVQLPQAAVAFDTDAGVVGIDSLSGGMTVSGDPQPGAHLVHWPSSVLAQLVTGYQGARLLALLEGTRLPPEALDLLTTLFPRCWRFSRNESWVFSR